MGFRKAQAGLEYLMTYGWAILIIVIVASALYVMGVFNPQSWTGNRVTGLSSFQVIGYKLTPTTFNMSLGSRLPNDITIQELSLDCTGDTFENTAMDVSLKINNEVKIHANNTTEVSIVSGDKVTCDVRVVFDDDETGFTNLTDTGIIALTVS